MSSQGLVKKLLFPAYADAGASSAFTADEDRERCSHHDNVEAGKFAKSDDQISIATTAIQDNRSNIRFDKNNNNRKSKSPASDIKNSKMIIPPKAMDTRNDGQSKTSPFFPSTTPFVSRAPPSRSVSTITSIGIGKLENSSLSQSDLAPDKELNDSTIVHANLKLKEDDNLIQNENNPKISNDIAKVCDIDNKNRSLDSSGIDELSEILSTCSEMGTLINISTRLADLDLLTPKEEESYMEENYMNIGENLVLPILGENQNDNPNNDSINVEAGRDQFQPGPKKMVTAMVSAAFKRLENDIGSHGQNDPSSTPSTPIVTSSVEDYLKSAYRSTGQAVPASFLLRSPGSEARQKLANGTRKGIVSKKRPTLKLNNRNTRHLRRSKSLSSPIRVAQDDNSFEERDEESNITERQSSIMPETIQSAQLEVNLDEIQEKESVNLFNIKNIDNSPIAAETQYKEEFEFSSAFRFQSNESQMLHAKAKRHSSFISPRKSQKFQDFSSPLRNTKNTIELRSTQRVNIEREDALDILQTFVIKSMMLEIEEGKEERGVKGNDGSNKFIDNNENCSVHNKVSNLTETGTQVQHSEIESTPKNDANSNRGHITDFEYFVSNTVNKISKISKLHSNEEDHENWMKVSKKLLRSHNYAIEMKRAAHSASNWLKTIKYGDMGSGRTEKTPPQINISLERDDSSIAHAKRSESEYQNGESSGSAMDSLTLRATMRSLQLYAKEKEDEVKRLNGELSECRAEIGRLKCASHIDNSFQSSANRSILDDDDISDASETANIASPVGLGTKKGVAKESSPLVYDQAELKIDDMEEHCVLMESALHKANDVIRDLFVSNKKQMMSPSENSVAPVVPIPKFKPASRKTQNDINWMNPSADRNIEKVIPEDDTLVSEWKKELPLSLPKDVSLSSPVVNAILENWTTDSTMHKSLLSWMQSVLEGVDPLSIPPLTLSGLENQVRDDMLLHILPILQKRPDISIDVRSRTHRKTFHDIAVKVNSEFLRSNINCDKGKYIVQRNIDISRDDGNTSTSYSTTTDQVTNLSSRSLPRSNKRKQDLTDRINIEASVMHDESSNFRAGNPGLISTLNSTLGGFLSRNKKTDIQQTYYSLEDRGYEAADASNREALLNQGEGNTSSEPQPYQRVLSCPPGRIGVTFVQYRGHAMVSDVAPESPLSSWVFPSDILIAIDEVPVSGMRVRDIVKLLTARKDRQRALRVISSHAMNEVTLNTNPVNLKSNT